MPVLGFSGSKWLWCLSTMLACWSCLSFGSSACEWLWCFAAFLACWSCLSLVFQRVSGCGTLLQFWPADHNCLWLSRKWVAVLPCYNFSLLIMPVLGSPVCKWLWCLATILSCWSCLPCSSACEWLWCHDTNLSCWCCLPWLFSLWVAVVPFCSSSLLIMPVLCSPDGEWLWCLATTLACWSCLSLAL